MNPIHSPRKEHSKSEFGKKNSEEKLGESETFSGSKSSPATGVTDMNRGNARRILSKGSTLLKGCWFWSKKLHFRKNFDTNFIAVETVTTPAIFPKTDPMNYLTK